MEHKLNKLLSLTLQMGYFFSMCDGSIDKRETDFVNSFVNRVCENYRISPQQIKELQLVVDKETDIDKLIEATNELLYIVEEGERTSLLRMLSYFINQIIKADSIIHPMEEKYYSRWKKAFHLDNNTNIGDLLDSLNT
jgi:uncharacterized tellurite resistance protein B-like protein